MHKQPAIFLNFILPSFDNILWMAAFFGVLLRGRRMMNADGDMGRHITIGKYIFATRKIPLQDIFSHTMTGQSLTPHEWLSQLIFGITEKLFGLEGIILLCALIIGATIYFVSKHVQKENKTLLPGLFVSLLTMFTTMIHWLTRPHIFTFLLLTLWMIVLSQIRKGKIKQWWFLPILMLLWANLHGAFIAGFVTWFIYGFGVAWDVFWKRMPDGDAIGTRFWIYYLLGGITSFLATLINPSGFNLWKTSVGYLGEKYLVDRTVEYMSPNFHDISFWPLLIYIGLLIIVLGFSKKFISSGLLFNGAAWFLMSLYSARNIPLFAIIAAPLLVKGLNDLLLTESLQRKFITRLRGTDFRLRNLERQLKGYLWPVLSILFVVSGFLMGFGFNADGQTYVFDPEVFPVAAVDWIEDNPQEGEMFNYFTWGGYMLYRQWPEKRVFIDGQTDFYGESLTREYVEVMELQDGWEDVIDKYHVGWVILPADSNTAQEIQEELKWKIVYKDSIAVVLHK